MKQSITFDSTLTHRDMNFHNTFLTLPGWDKTTTIHLWGAHTDRRAYSFLSGEKALEDARAFAAAFGGTIIEKSRLIII